MRFFLVLVFVLATLAQEDGLSNLLEDLIEEQLAADPENDVGFLFGIAQKLLHPPKPTTVHNHYYDDYTHYGKGNTIDKSVDYGKKNTIGSKNGNTNSVNYGKGNTTKYGRGKRVRRGKGRRLLARLIEERLRRN